MKSRLVSALSLASLMMLAGCQSTVNGAYSASEVEKKFYKECAPTPTQPPCGHY